MIVNESRHGFTDAVRGFQVLERGISDRLGRAEMIEKRFLSLRPYAVYVFKERAPHRLRAAATMSDNSEAVYLIADPLKEIQNRAALFQCERLTVWQKKTLAASIAFLAFGDGRERDVFKPQLGQNLLYR